MSIELSLNSSNKHNRDGFNKTLIGTFDNNVIQLTNEQAHALIDNLSARLWLESHEIIEFKIGD